MARIPLAVRRDFEEAVRLGNANEHRASLLHYARGLDAIPEALRPVVPEMVLELDAGRAMCLCAL